MYENVKVDLLNLMGRRTLKSLEYLFAVEVTEMYIVPFRFGLNLGTFICFCAS